MIKTPEIYAGELKSRLEGLSVKSATELVKFKKELAVKIYGH